MRGRLMLTALLALSLHGCGSGDNDDPAGKAAPAQVQHGSAVAAKPSTSARPADGAAHEGAPAKATLPQQASAGGGPSRFVPGADVRKLKGGKHPAVMVIASDEDDGNAEAAHLASLGMSVLVVTAPEEPASPAAFRAEADRMVRELRRLAGRDGVDPLRLAVVGRGLGAHYASIVAGREPHVVAAVMVNTQEGEHAGAAMAPSRWLSRSSTARVLFQVVEDWAGLDESERLRLVAAAPPGTVEKQYTTIGKQTEHDRDVWLRNEFGL